MRPSFMYFMLKKTCSKNKKLGISGTVVSEKIKRNELHFSVYSEPSVVKRDFVHIHEGVSPGK